MPVIKVDMFSGLAPRLGPSKLEDNQAQISNNTKLMSGELRPWQKELLMPTVAVYGGQSLYQYNGPADATRWLTWATDVDVAASPLVDDGDYRIYYTGSGTPKKTNWTLSESGPGPLFPVAKLEMGVPNPVAAPGLSNSGGSGSAETRAYVYTYVSTFGDLQEESGPSPAATVSTFETGATVTINGFSAVPAGDYNITSIRIYRSVTGGTSTVYLFVKEIPIATGSTTDALTVTQLGTPLQTLYYNTPPAALQGLVSMANGILAGFVGNTVYFSEPYQPHAWPSTYTVNTEYPVVGLGVFGTSLVVCTTRNPYIVSGVHPSVMSQEKLSMPYSCISKKSIVYDQHGVLYASPFGLVAIGPGTQDVITRAIMTQDEWAALEPETMVGALYGNLYIGFYNIDGEYNSIVLNRGDQPAMTRLKLPAAATYVNRESGKLFIINAVDSLVYQVDGDATQKMTYEWKSKRFVFPTPVNMAAIQVDANYLEGITDVDEYNALRDAALAANGTMFEDAVAGDTPLGGEWNQAEMNQLMFNNSDMRIYPQAEPANITVTIYADDRQVFSGNFTDFEPRRLPSGFRARRWEFIVAGTTPVRAVVIATSMGEIKRA